MNNYTSEYFKEFNLKVNQNKVNLDNVALYEPHLISVTKYYIIHL